MGRPRKPRKGPQQTSYLLLAEQLLPAPDPAIPPCPSPRGVLLPRWKGKKDKRTLNVDVLSPLIKLMRYGMSWHKILL